MRIFVVPGTPDCSNLGDLAMLQAGWARLRALWPDASFQILTRNRERLDVHCPGAEGVPWAGAKYWFRVKALPSQLFSRVRPEVRARFPFSLSSAAGLARLIGPRKYQFARNFAEALFNADLVVLSGCGIITDAFRREALTILNLFEAATRAGIPGVMLGQGIGPVREQSLLRAAQVLPQLKAIFLRECRAGSSLLESLGVSSEKIFFTGDDSVEMAFRERRPAPGRDLGINLRMADYAGLNDGIVETVRAALFDKARADGAALRGISILRGGRSSDGQTVQSLLAGWSGRADAGDEADTPLKVIRRVSDCRLVVAGSYHAAVFALAQGVPVVGVVQSAYYADKFHGLAGQYGRGCVVVRADDGAFSDKLRGAIAELWRESGDLRPGLLAVAESQIKASQATYALLPELIQS